MKVTQLTNDKGNKVNNHFIIYDSEYTIFRSYNSNIIKVVFEDCQRKVYLDSYYWNYSRTTAKYRNYYLGESTKEIETKIKNGTYLLTNLNN
jgi:hypothetical protein